MSRTCAVSNVRNLSALGLFFLVVSMKFRELKSQLKVPADKIPNLT